MIIRAPHPFIDQPNTYLTSSVAAAATTITVANNAEFTGNDHTVFGKMGQEGAELHKVSSVSGNHTINYVSDAIKFAMDVNTPITYIKYNCVKYYLGDWSARYSTGSIAVTKDSAVVNGTGTNWAAITTAYALLLNGKWYNILSVDSATQVTLADNYTDETTTYNVYAFVGFTVQATVAIAIDQLETLWDDTDALAEDYYRTAYYNSTSTATSNKSSIISAAEPAGFSEFSMRVLEDAVLSELRDKEAKRTTREEIDTYLNDCLRDLINVIVADVQEDYLGTYQTLNLTTNGEEPLFSDFRRMTAIWVSYDGVAYIKASPMRISDDIPNAQYSEGDPYYYLRDNVLGIRPVPTAVITRGAKIWYERRVPSFRYEGDEIPNILRDFKRLFVDYALSKANNAEDDKKRLEYSLTYAQGRKDMVKALKDRDKDQTESIEIVNDYDIYY